MPRFTSTEASIYNGISQQSAELRLPSQVTDVENASLTVPRGIERRPPVELIEDSKQYYDEQSLVHEIPFDSNTHYFMTIAGEASTAGSRVFSTSLTAGGDHNNPIIYQPGTQTYLETPNADGDFIPIEALQMTTILDFTFVCNKNVVPAMNPFLTPNNRSVGYLWVSNGVQEVDRTIVVDGVSHTHAKIPDNDTVQIVDFFEGAVNGQAGFSAVRVSDSVLKIVPDVDAPFSFTATDSYSDTTMKAVLSDGCKFEELPPSATDDQIMTIVAETNTESEYYLRYDVDTKVWSETSAPASERFFDSTSMPHAFIRKIDDGVGTVTGVPLQTYFELENIDWAPRTSGGGPDDSLPSFIGNKITDTFFFKNRLGFIAGENVVLSATDDLFRFWPTTIREVLDDDPIDTTISSTKSVELSHVAPFPESLIIVGDTEQFSLGSGGKAFTPENAILDPTTTYSASKIVPPVTSGSTLYFIAPQSSHAAVREYAVQPDTLVTDAADVTGHVPRLIDNNIKQMISEPNLEYLFLVDKAPYTEEGNLLYVYKFLWQGNEKIQSAWHKWRFWFNPIGGGVFNGSLYLIGYEFFEGVQRTVFVRVNLSDNPPIELDTKGNPYKISRPNIDREFGVVVIGEPLVQKCTLTIEVDENTFKYFDIADSTVVLVDKISGLVYRYVDRFMAGGKFYLTFSFPYCPDDLGELECLILGGYTVGSCEFFD